MPTKKRSATRSAASSSSRPPEPLTLFLDESLDATVVVDALRAAGATVERLTDQAARVRAFVFTDGNVGMKDTGKILASALPRIERIARKDPGPFIYHIGKSGRPVRMS